MTTALSSYREIAQRYLPCNPLSKRHHLSCGHRIETQDPEPCGSNCMHAGTGTQYLCRACIIQSVLIGLGIADDNDVGDFDASTIGNIPEAIVEEEVSDQKSALGGKFREGRIPKVYGLVEFLNENPGAKEAVRGERREEKPCVHDVELLFQGLGLREHLDVKDLTDVLAALVIDSRGNSPGDADVMMD
ncbi:hypothetical protein P280DRAFT_517036 [Massarina eburnea CBS 473.64]|uniref:Uncharacterized protein n=1 Tax=Massarina eburnea CBS 473.64 TaxID=1395130 RepID=A0A6A6S4G2_9PLEO|nr:hypothetical protein P280DRAFT_517036 [Massarina eburnea CBS 473.64]